MNVTVLACGLFCLSAPLCRALEVDVQISLSKTTIMLGEPLWVDVSATNRSSEPIFIGMPHECPYNKPLNVSVPSAEQLVDTTHRCGVEGPYDCQIPSPTKAEPGATIARRYVLDGLFRFTHPGTYEVRIETALQLSDTSPQKLGIVQTAKTSIPLTITRANPRQLLALELAMAQDADAPMPKLEHPRYTGDPNGFFDEMQRQRDTDNQASEEWFTHRALLAAGLARYPAPGMEPVFREWLEQRRDGAASGLSQLNTPEARAILAEFAEKEDEPGQPTFSRAALVWALGRLGDRTYLPLLERLTHDANHEVQREAIFGLGPLGGEAELPLLEQVARTGATMSDRQDAVMSIGDTASLKAVPILIDLLTVPDSDQPYASLYAIQVLTHQTPPAWRGKTNAETQTAWRAWWTQQSKTARAYDPFECDGWPPHPAESH